jgi:hypothetical protein
VGETGWTERVVGGADLDGREGACLCGELPVEAVGRGLAVGIGSLNPPRWESRFCRKLLTQSEHKR